MVDPAKLKFVRIIDDRARSVAMFSLFSAWLLTVPFEGQVMYAMAEKYETLPHAFMFGAMAAHFLGLVTCGFFVRSLQAARKTILWSVSFCVLGSAVFLMPPSLAWSAFLWAASFLMGLCVAAWGYYLKAFTTPTDRTKTVAEGLICSNALMLPVNAVVANLSPYLGLALAVSFLIGALVIGTRLRCDTRPLESEAPSTGAIKGSALGIQAKPLFLLCLFIGVITIDSGLMYHVVGPAYSHHASLSSWYWAVPYIAALCIMKRSLRNSNRGYVLYAAIAMMGLAFLAFMTLDRSVGSYLLVDTLMLGACGVYDLFWWSILAGMLEFGPNPAVIFGVGLSSNVMGVLVGGLIGRMVFRGIDITADSSSLALAILFIIAAMLPRLQRELSLILNDHAFLMVFDEAFPKAPPGEREEVLDRLGVVSRLTDREKEVADLLLQGRTYKAIARHLAVSENTVKYHVKNIYSKVNVQNKVELINQLTKRAQS